MYDRIRGGYSLRGFTYFILSGNFSLESFAANILISFVGYLMRAERKGGGGVPLRKEKT